MFLNVGWVLLVIPQSTPFEELIGVCFGTIHASDHYLRLNKINLEQVEHRKIISYNRVKINNGSQIF